MRMIASGDSCARDMLFAAYRQRAQEKVLVALQETGVTTPDDGEVASLAEDALGRSTTRSSEMFRYHLLVDWWARKLVKDRVEATEKADKAAARKARHDARHRKPRQSAE